MINKPPILKTLSLILAILGLLATGNSQAATVSLNASDAGGTTSFDTPGHWTDGAAPSAGNDYFTSTFQLRTPTAAANSTFAGGSLTINGGSMLYKNSGNRTITINNLTLDNGSVNVGNSGATMTLAGNGITVNTKGTLSTTPDSADRVIVVTAPFLGSGTITTAGRNQVHLTSTTSTFNGKWVFSAAQTRVAVDAVLGAVPASLVSDSITFDGGTMINRDTELVLAANRGITLTTNGGAIEAGWSKLITINGPITGVGGLTIANDATPGVISLNGVNTYTGPTRVANSVNNWAILLVNGSLDAASTMAITAKGWLGGTGIINGPLTATNNATLSAGPLFKAGTLTVNNNVSLTNSILSFDLSNTTTEGANVNDLLQINGDLTLDGTITVNLYPLADRLANGTYRLINYTGTLNGDATNLVAAPSPYTITFDTATPGQVNMTVSGAPADLVWTAASNYNWDVNTTLNWLNGATASVFHQGDNVLFNDAGLYASNVTMVGEASAANTLAPASVTVDVATNVTLTTVGSGGRLGGSMGLYKAGAGTLTLNTGNVNLPNYYDGPTVITNGVLKPGYARALGTLTGATYATNGGTLDVNAQNIGFEPVFIQGTGAGEIGALVNNGSGEQQNALRTLTLLGDATVGGTQRFDLRGNPADTVLSTEGQPFTLTKTGSMQFSLVSANIDPALGDVDIRQGTLSFELNSTSLGNPEGTLTVGSNATFLLWAATNALDKKIVLNGGATPSISSGSGSNVIVGPVTLNADSILTFGGNTGLRLQGPIGGSGGLIKGGNNASTLYLEAANTYTGNTVISNGTLALAATGTLDKSASIRIGDGAFLDVSAGSFSLANGQTLSGSGTVVGDVTAGPGTAILPGSSLGTLTFNNALNLGGIGSVFELGSSPYQPGANDLISASLLNLSGVNTIRIVPVAPLDTTVPYTLIQYGALLSGGVNNLQITTDSRYQFTLLDPTAVGAIQVSVTGTGTAADLVWQGGQTDDPTAWDTKATSNWLNGTVSDRFYVGDKVTFDDTAVSSLVTLKGTLAPSVISLSNNATSYTFGGDGALAAGSLNVDGVAALMLTNNAANSFVQPVTVDSGAVTFANNGANLFSGGVNVNGGTLTFANTAANTLSALNLYGGSVVFDQLNNQVFSALITGYAPGTIVKEGTNTLTLAANNSAFSGAVALNNGVLRAGAGSAVGSGTLSIANGATLDVNGQNLSTLQVTAAGAGVDGRGAIDNAGGAAQSALTYVTLAGNTTFGASVQRWDIVQGGTLAGAGYALAKNGIQEIWIKTGSDTDLGNIDIQQGRLGFQNTGTTLGRPANIATVRAGASLGFYANQAAGDKQIALEDNSSLYASGGVNGLGGTMTFQGTNRVTFGGSGDTLIYYGAASGTGSLQAAGAGNLILAGTNVFEGPMLITGGTLTLSNSLALGEHQSVLVTSTTGGSGLSGSRLSLAGDIVTPPGVWASFPSASAGDIRSTIYSASGTNEWTGPLSLNGNGLVNFGADDVNMLIISGPVTNDLFAGTMFLRGTGRGLVKGSVNLPNGNVNKTDAATWMISSTGNIWSNSMVSVGTLQLGAHDALCTTAPLTMGQNDGNALSLDLNGFNQVVPQILSLGTGTRRIGNDSATSDSLFTYDGGTNVSTYVGAFVDNLTTNGTRKLALTVASGSLTLNRASTYTGPTTIKSGATLGIGTSGSNSKTPLLDVQAGATFDVSALSAFTLADGQTLKGNGAVLGSLTVGSNATVSVGASIGALTVSGQVLCLADSIVAMEIDNAAGTNDVINAAGITYGGKLVVTSLAGTLAGGSKFKLFNAASYSGSFASTELPALTGELSWDLSGLTLDGTIKVIGVPKTPTNITWSLSSSGLKLSWPADYTGWQLLVQTNGLASGVSTNPLDWDLVPGSTATNEVTLPIDNTKPAQFYRLANP